MPLPPELFAKICFLVLMEGSGGLLFKSPDYIDEKSNMLHEGYTAFAYLDIHNMRKVNDWHAQWKLELPPVIAQELARQEEALKSLQDKGMFL